MIPASSGPNFWFQEIPWLPSSFAKRDRIVTPVASERITAAKLPVGGMKLKDWPLVHASMVGEFGEYTYSHKQSDERGSSFFWQPNFSADELENPYLVKWESAVHPWPPYLEELKFVRDRTTGVAVEREAFHDGVSVSCDILVEYFIKAGPFEQADIKTDEPVPGPVSWDFQTTKGPIAGRFPDCLHSLVEVPTRGDPNLEIIDAMPNSAVMFGNMRRFEATNHTRWRPHVYANKADNDRGLYFREQRTVFPPRGARTIKL